MSENPALKNEISTGDKAAFDKKVEENTGLIMLVIKRYFGTGYDAEDLFQVGTIGLIKAVKRFNPDFGVMFSTYAVPMIAGEIRRFLRDDGMLKISRTIKENAMKGRRTREKLLNELCREPTMTEISAECNIPVEDLLYAFECCSGYDSLNEIVAGENTELEAFVGAYSHEEETINRIWIAGALDELSSTERSVIVMRYLQGKTQSVIAEKIGTSQVQVSRIEKRALLKMREKMEYI